MEVQYLFEKVTMSQRDRELLKALNYCMRNEMKMARYSHTHLVQTQLAKHDSVTWTCVHFDVVISGISIVSSI